MVGGVEVDGVRGSGDYDEAGGGEEAGYEGGPGLGGDGIVLAPDHEHGGVCEWQLLLDGVEQAVVEGDGDSLRGRRRGSRRR